MCREGRHRHLRRPSSVHERSSYKLWSVRYGRRVAYEGTNEVSEADVGMGATCPWPAERESEVRAECVGGSWDFAG